MTDWIEHKGGICPVDLVALVDLKTRGGPHFGPGREYNRVRAHDWKWEHCGNETDVTFYRVHEEPALSHEEAMAAIRGACSVSMLSYEEAIAFYFKARRMKKPDDIAAERERCAIVAEASYIAHLVSNSIELTMANRVKDLIAFNIRRTT